MYSYVCLYLTCYMLVDIIIHKKALKNMYGKKANYADGLAVGIDPTSVPRITDVADMPTAAVGIGSAWCGLDQ